MGILNADIVRWAGLTKYVIYRKRGAFDSAHSYTLNGYIGSIQSYIGSIQSYIGSIQSYIGSIQSYIGSMRRFRASEIVYHMTN